MTKQTQVASRRAGEFTFGIEIETLAPCGLLDVGSYRYGYPLSGFRGWRVHNDASVSTRLLSHTPVELVSPILNGVNGLDHILKISKFMDKHNFKTNATCGTHVHVGVESVAGYSPGDQAGWIANLTNLVAQFEQAIRGAAGSRRRLGSHWCLSIKTDDNKRIAEHVRKSNKRQMAKIRSLNHYSRYHLLNITNVGDPCKNTVEFRAFSGTTDGFKMISWVQMCLALAERALGRKAAWDRADTSTYDAKRLGDSYKAINRFLSLMGWKLGRRDVGLDECAALGVLDLSNIKEMRKELRRLCKKFDNETTGG